MHTNYDELYHHGIKGQKWGVRRFQNPDGTRTPAGKERYKSNPAETASWVHEVSSSARVNSSSKEKMLNAIQGSLDEGKEAVRSSAQKKAKAFKQWQDSEEAANKAWSDSKELRQKYSERVPRTEIKQMEKKYGERYSGVDGPTTVDEYVRDRARHLYSNSSEPIVQESNRNYKAYKKANEALERDCKKFANSFLGAHGLDSAVSMRDGSVTTVTNVFSDYLSSKASKE